MKSNFNISLPKPIYLHPFIIPASSNPRKVLGIMDLDGLQKEQDMEEIVWVSSISHKKNTFLLDSICLILFPKLMIKSNKSDQQIDLDKWSHLAC